MKEYMYIFVIVIYRNTVDIIECLNSIKEKVSNYKVVLVDNYYDDETKEMVANISKQYDCDFISTSNRGYGAGNNKGIEFACSHYNFNYLVISNPDIIIDQFDDTLIANTKRDSIIAPLITTINGKIQNPYRVKNCNWAEKRIYLGMKKERKIDLVLGYGYFKIQRMIFMLFFRKSKRRSKKIAAAHGSFVIIPKSILERTGFKYDENMFLFAEENYMSYYMNNAGVDFEILKNISILHKEDGSIDISNINEKNELKKTTIYYYEKYIKK